MSPHPRSTFRAKTTLPNQKRGAVARRVIFRSARPRKVPCGQLPATLAQLVPESQYTPFDPPHLALSAALICHCGAQGASDMTTADEEHQQ